MKGVSLAEVAEAVGCGKSYLSQIETGINMGTPGLTLLAAVEKFLGMRPGDLAERAAWRSAPEPIKQHVARLAARDRATQQLALHLREKGLDTLYKSGELGALVDQLAPGGGVPGMGEEKPGGLGRKPGPIDSAPIELPLEVPLINSVAAGYPRSFTDLGYPARIADQYVRSPDVRDPDAFACRVVGDSMEPVYREGDVVIFSPARQVKDGVDCFVRFERDEQTTFKRVFFEREGGSTDEKAPVVRLRLQPLNGKYPTRVVAREDVAGLYTAVSVTRAIG
jgi:phage repressor protein C with HTH and peptisase S24 domain